MSGDLCHDQSDIVVTALRGISKRLCQEDSHTEEVNHSNMIIRILQLMLRNRER